MSPSYTSGAKQEDGEEEDENVRNWKQSPYAVGYGDADWEQEINCCKYWCSKPQSQPPQPHNYACNQLTAFFCRGAGRIGNMVVLHKNALTEEPVIVVGPYWPMMMCVTYPLILAVLTATAVLRIPYLHWGLVIAWIISSVAILLALAFVACRNPGILKRQSTLDENDRVSSDWIWNDQALSYRPESAKYDRDCNCIIEEFDHTCPWTGTGIGKLNLRAFYCFVTLVPICLIFNVVLLTMSMFDDF